MKFENSGELKPEILVALLETIKNEEVSNMLIVDGGDWSAERVADWVLEFCTVNQLSLDFISFDKKNSDLLVVKTEQHEFLLSFELPDAKSQLNNVMDAMKSLV